MKNIIAAVVLACVTLAVASNSQAFSVAAHGVSVAHASVSAHATTANTAHVTVAEPSHVVTTPARTTPIEAATNPSAPVSKSVVVTTTPVRPVVAGHASPSSAASAVSTK